MSISYTNHVRTTLAPASAHLTMVLTTELFYFNLDVPVRNNFYIQSIVRYWGCYVTTPHLTQDLLLMDLTTSL
jgi:hypothetical protein